MKSVRSLNTLSLSELQREIRARQRRASVLERRRNKVVRQLEALDAQIAAIGGLATKSGLGQGAATRARNKAPLLEALATLLKGKQMSVTTAADEVRKAGYHTTSPNFRTMVNIALLNKKRFKRVGRGVYTSI